MVRSIVSLFVVWYLLAPPVSNSCKAENAVPAIGFILPLSGDWAHLGGGIRDGALLAQQDLRRRGQDIRLLFEDNKGDLAISAASGKKLVEVDKVDGLISIISGVGNVLKPFAARRGIIHIGICSDTDVADGETNFVNYLTADQAVAKYLEHLEDASSIGIFSLQESGFQRIVTQLQQKVMPPGRVIFHETFERGVSNFRPLIVRRKNAGADIWLILGLSPEIELLVRQARSLGMVTPISSIEGFGLANDKSPFEGAWFVDAATPNEEFLNRYKDHYRRDAGPGVGHAYDSVMLLAEAYTSSKRIDGTIDRSHARTAFREIKNFRGVVGDLDVRVGGVIWSEASIKVVRQGVVQPISSQTEAAETLDN